MPRKLFLLPTLALIALTPLAWAARDTNPFAGPGFHPRGSWSGFEDREAELGKAVAKAIREVGKAGVKDHDFAGRETELGHGVATVIRTLNVDSPYQHEINDALVKMTLSYIQFAKDQGRLKEMLEHEIATEMPMLNANRRRIAESGDLDIAIMAVSDRTACFYQLALAVKRAPGQVSWKSPYGTVLAMTRQLGQHTLTEKEVHDIFTVPRLKLQAEKMGVHFDVSPWQEDGWITVKVSPLKKVAST
jgi:hypothetical protein